MTQRSLRGSLAVNVIARFARGNVARNRLDTVALFAILRRGFARDSAHSPVKASARASRGIQHTRFGRALSGGRTGSGEGECAGLSF